LILILDTAPGFLTPESTLRFCRSAIVWRALSVLIGLEPVALAGGMKPRIRRPRESGLPSVGVRLLGSGDDQVRRLPLLMILFGLVMWCRA